MSRLFAFLRAINVGGHVVKMEVLKRNFEHLGLQNVETFIASGNVIFRTRSKQIPLLERKIEKQLQAALGYEVRTFIRTGAELKAIAGYAPFDPAAMQAAAALMVGFLAEPLGAAAERLLMSFRNKVDDFHVNGREVYWLCRTRQSDSAFVGLEKAVKVRTTLRGLKTIHRLAARY